MTCENCDSLAAQVVRLRDHIKALVGLHCDAGSAIMEALTSGNPVVAHQATSEIDAIYHAAANSLADTEAAATTWLEADRREQRRAGARKFAAEVKRRGISFRQALEEMEREDTPGSKPPPPAPPDHPMHTQL